MCVCVGFSVFIATFGASLPPALALGDKEGPGFLEKAIFAETMRTHAFEAHGNKKICVCK